MRHVRVRSEQKNFWEFSTFSAVPVAAAWREQSLMTQERVRERESVWVFGAEWEKEREYECVCTCCREREREREILHWRLSRTKTAATRLSFGWLSNVAAEATACKKKFASFRDSTQLGFREVAAETQLLVETDCICNLMAFYWVTVYMPLLAIKFLFPL